jgi:urea transport system ATP-binding protein
LLKVEGLTAGYHDGGIVLDGIDLEVGDGESIALMGRNGMGKTTLLRTIMGHLRPSSGKILFDGVNIAGWQPFRISNAGIGYVPQGREIFKDFTVEQNLVLGLIGKKAQAVRVPEPVYARFPLLKERRLQTAGTLSGGEQQQLAIARAIVSRPRLLLLDEPSEGIQPSIVQSLGLLLAAISSEDRMSILLVEQNLELVLAVTQHCLFIENGRIAAQQAVNTLRSNRGLLDHYLSV